MLHCLLLFSTTLVFLFEFLKLLLLSLELGNVIFLRWSGKFLKNLNAFGHILLTYISLLGNLSLLRPASQKCTLDIMLLNFFLKCYKWLSWFQDCLLCVYTSNMLYLLLFLSNEGLFLGFNYLSIEFLI